MLSGSFLFLAAMATASPPGACTDGGDAAGRVRTLILDWRTQEAQGQGPSPWAQIVAAEAAQVPGLEVLTTADLRAALALEADKQLMGCGDGAECIAEIAEALDATLVVQGELSRGADGATLIGLALQNARAVVVVNRVNLTWRGSDDSLPDVVRAGTQLLLLDKSQRKPGSIQIEGLPGDARVFLDDVDVSARAANGELATVEVGVHVLRATTPGKLPVTLPVVVRAGTRSVVVPVFEDEPAGLGWIVAGGAVAVVAGVGATLGVLWALRQDTVTVQGSAAPYAYAPRPQAPSAPTNDAPTSSESSSEGSR